MKNTRRFISALTALTIVSAVTPMSAFADTVVDDTNNPAPQSAGFNVKYTYEAVAPTYTVTIPAGVTLSDSDNVDATITAENVANMAENDLKIAVTLDAASNDDDTDTTFHAKNGDYDATYTITANSTALKVGDKVAEFTADGSSTLTFSKIRLPIRPIAGDYTETLTFGISLEDVTAVNPYSTSNIGDVVTFGDYDWYVIGKSDDGITLLMQNNLESKKYNDSYANVTWENCSLRTYLNNDFYNSFSADDRAKIVSTHNSNPNNPDYNTSGGNETEDYIYLLSIEEAIALDSSIRGIGSWWWLRSPGQNSSHAAFVNEDGYVYAGGLSVDDENGVRPALNLKF